MIKVISPIDGKVYVERPLAKAAEIDSALDRARVARYRLATASSVLA